ncbi:apolipoprotein N-acyltransferase [Legionella londiniensis]|uniref:Apolipoprotein N-acyltransferase n=1 Tax=Legionella londiniensis TaxID=45068 RepID=A0A0W0VM72_9GAMM|nr:apolipoprotein N-acyltransferase [Legionella londiniensis]KTD21253.1 apolipoprotein N-acyltransferase [Legionella londiniensis]STX93279.1 apolipoprotein N-acyltransferase [Legionella londiniensis]
MNYPRLTKALIYPQAITARFTRLLLAFLSGILLPIGFAPFHLPGFSLLGIALLFALLKDQTAKNSFYHGLFFGLGYLGFGVSWVYVSVHEYGHIAALGSGLITLFFVFYLSLYFAIMALAHNKLTRNRSTGISCLLFAALWCITEYLRARGSFGFPWLLVGFGQIDTPLKYLLPIFGVYGAGFLAVLAATFLAAGLFGKEKKRHLWVLAFVSILIAPSLLKNKSWSHIEGKPFSVGVIQANLSMRDKWDDSFFWTILQYYNKQINQLMGQVKLIVMPESAIPLPSSYISEIIETIHRRAKRKQSGILLGMLQTSAHDENQYHNAMIALGTAEGIYLKRQLVPFGEFIPKAFQSLIDWLALPVANIAPGKAHQSLLTVDKHPVATLICYELAYPELLRRQMPNAEWIVSISDDGWFGHSLAMYQQMQMAQALSVLTGRYQIVANNDGLSSIINDKGDIITSLPAFKEGVLRADIYPAKGNSPWTLWGDLPVLIACFALLFVSVIHGFIQSAPD